MKILALSLRLVRLHPRVLMAALLGLLCVVALLGRCSRGTPAVASFNIQDFPKHAAQVPAAFATMRELDVPVLAVQEIGDVAVFEAAMHEHLGRHWRAVFNHEPGPGHADQRQRLVGLAWDQRRYTLDFHVTHDDVRVVDGQRPALEVRLVPRGRGPALRVFVVHLKAGGQPSDQQLRRRQLEQLWLVVGDAVRSWDEIIVLGDFNATGEADRRALEAFAAETHLVWASRSLPCTAYWRPDGSCQGSALDHVFTRNQPQSIAAKGPCEDVGCSPGERCPIFYDQVSDHCPVAVEL